MTDFDHTVGSLGWVLFAFAVLGCLVEEVWHLRQHWHQRQLDSAFAAQISVSTAV